METAETIDPRSLAWRAATQDRDAGGDERDLLVSSHRLPLALCHAANFHRATLYNIFRKFQKDGVWEAIWEELHMTLREQRGREAGRTAAGIDSQTLKAAEKGAVLMARQAMTPGSKVKGRKIHALVDTEGLPLRASAGLQDRPFDELRRRSASPRQDP